MAKYRFQVLRGRHIEGFATTDPVTGHIRRATQEEMNDPDVAANLTPATYYRNGPLGDIVECDKNLLKFNSRGSTKFKLLAKDDDIVPDVDDGLEQMTVAQLKAYLKDNAIEVEGNPDNLRKSDLIKAAREALLYA